MHNAKNRYNMRQVLKYVGGVIACMMVFGTSLAQASNATTFYVPINRSELITTPVDMGEVIVADPDVADVYVHGKNKVSVIGKSLGQTSIRLFDTDNRLIRSATVHVTYDLPAIRKALRDFLPYERIGVDMVNTKVALTGEVRSAQAASTAIEIAEQFIRTKQDPNDGQDTESISPTSAAEERSPIINLMSIVSGQQVMLRIRVGEIQRTALKRLGVSLQAIKSSGSVPFQIATGGGILSPDLVEAGESLVQFNRFNLDTQDLFGTGSLSYLNSSGNGIAGTIEALERDGLFKVLAEPNLVSLSGERAQFLAGGEFPIPVPQDEQTITVEYKPFGVSVEFTPYVLSENRIRVHVQPEVSEISNENSIEINGFVAPSLSTRRANTTVELAPGESFMIAGLIRDNMTSTIESIPGLSEIPILSSLFRSTQYQRNETELVLAVTPYIVNPMRSSDVKLPTDDFRPASLMESMFYGSLSSLSGGAARAAEAPSLEGPVGFITD